MTASSNTNPTLNEPFNNDHFESLPHAPCITRYHRFGRAGCGTWGRGVMTGRLLDWNSVIENNDEDGDRAGGDAQGEGGGDMPPYVAVIDEEYYTSDNVAKLIVYSQQYKAGNNYGDVEDGYGPLRGLLVLARSSTTSSADNNNQYVPTSPEPMTPQGDHTPSASLTIGSSYEWNVNSGGDGLTTADMYGLPTAYVADAKTAAYLKNVASEQSASLKVNVSNNGVDVDAAVYPSIVSEFNYYMGPGGELDENGKSIYNSEKCLGWKDTDGEWTPRCAPMGGNSVWAVAGSPIPLGYSNEANANGNDANANNNDGGDNDNASKKPVILVSTSIDSTSMFYGMAPGANSAASNILTVLMAAQLIGSTIKDEVLNQLQSQITFAFFQGESYGYIGSRRFLKDVLEGFQCSDGNEGVSSVYKRKDEKDETTGAPKVARACLYPMRADLTFQNLGEVRGMIAVDQLGNLGGSKNMFVQGGESTDGGNGLASFLSQVMIELSAKENGDYYTQASSVENQDDGTAPLPPTPLTSLVSLSSAAVGGVALTGYDNAFVDNSLYHSHLDSTSSSYQNIDKDAIAYAATLVARSAVAAAYQNANNEVDYATAAAYAMELLPNAVDSNSEMFTTLFNCLFEDGNCDTLLMYGGVERANDAVRTGHDLGMGVPLETPPNFYTSIYNIDNGQASVYASGKFWGAMTGNDGERAKDKDGNDIKQYGDDKGDAFLLRPSLLEMSIHGLLNEFLGKGSFVDQGGGEEGPTLAKCKNSDECSSVSYCNTDTSTLVAPTCAGGSCVCGSRSHYHPALDEALSAPVNLATGRFEIENDDQGVSALYTEPYWSPYAGVRIYNDAGNNPGVYGAVFGSVFALGCLVFVWRLKRTLVKQKVY